MAPLQQGLEREPLNRMDARERLDEEVVALGVGAIVLDIGAADGPGQQISRIGKGDEEEQRDEGDPARDEHHQEKEDEDEGQIREQEQRGLRIERAHLLDGLKPLRMNAGRILAKGLDIGREHSLQSAQRRLVIEAGARFVEDRRAQEPQREFEQKRDRDHPGQERQRACGMLAKHAVVDLEDHDRQREAEDVDGERRGKHVASEPCMPQIDGAGVMVYFAQIARAP